MTFFRLFFALLIVASSTTIFSQETINIGENKKLVAVVESNGKMSVGYQDLTLQANGKPSFFIATRDTKWGPFGDMQKNTIASTDLPLEWSKDTTYLIVSEKGKKFILYGKYKFGPYDSPELIKIAQNKAIIADFSKKGMYYEILSLAGDIPKSITKGVKYKDHVTGIYVSDNMDVLMAFEGSSGDASHYFIYEEKKTGGFYYAVHFQGWLKTENDGLTPVFYCVAPLDDEEYDVTEDLYVGNRLIGNLVAVLYDFSFNSENTDFVMKGYTAAKDGARVYSANSILGPYESVDGLMYDSLDRIQFDYEQNGNLFSFENGAPKPLPQKEEYVWKNVSPNGVDFVKCMSVEDTSYYYFNDQLIASGDMWNFEFLTWTQKHGPVLFETAMKPAEPNPDPEGEKWYGEVTAGFRLIINGDTTKTFQSILDFKESAKGEIAYIAYDNDGYYVFRGDLKYGPYAMVYTIGKERENFLKWDGDDLIYSAIADRKSQVFKNGESKANFSSIISFYWNQNLASSAIVQIKDKKCFLESDFYSISLDRDPIVEQLEEQFQTEFAARREELLTLNDCVSIHFNGKEFGGLTFVHDLKFSQDGSVVSFMNMDNLNVIYKNELLNGTMINNRIVYYMNGNVVVSSLDE